MRTRQALAVVFVANGIGLPSFIARLSERQRDLELSDVALGATVLGMSFGALASSPLAGWAVHRYGSRQVTTGAALAIGASLWATGAAPTAPLTFAALAVAGAADAAMDAAMNANGAAFEASTGRSALHRLHGWWALGALVAAGVAALAASADVGMGVHLAIAGAVLALAAVVARPGLVPVDPTPPPADAGSAPRRLPRLLVVLGVATIAGAIAEGTIGDWSSLQLDRLGVSTDLAPLGFASFMAGMVVGRFVGDRSTDRLGATKVLRQGMTLCAAGLAAGVLIGEPLPFCAGVAVAGYGISAFFPLVFSASTRVPGTRAGTGTTTIALTSRVGFIIEPLVVGAIAEATDLRVAYLLAAAIAVAIAVAAPRLMV